ncbi:MAG: PorV/PorQ family protein [Elusimicrobia bacterium]|nr:PorV/PorQ family protein [Elusimicrobiota bacterium]
MALAAVSAFVICWDARPIAARQSGAAFLRISPSARSYSLGQSQGITALGAQSLGANPANLGLINGRLEFFTSYAALAGGAQYQHLAAAMTHQPVLGIDSVGVSLTRLSVGSLETVDGAGARTGGSFEASDMAISAALSTALTAGLRVGAAAKILRSQIAQYRSNAALAGDFGLTYTMARFSRPISIGMSVTHMGQGIKFIEQRDPLPTAINCGMALPVGMMTMIAEVNRHLEDRMTEVGTGLEFNVGPMAFRAGYLVQDKLGNLASKNQTGAARFFDGISGGLGLRVKALRIDYAISQQAIEFGSTHRLSLTLQWGRKADVRKEAAAPDWRAQPDRSDWMIRSLGSY